MADINISLRSAEGSEEQPFLLWDTLWDKTNKVFDWVLVPFGDTTEPQNNGGLQSRVPLDTTILLQLGTDRRAEQNDDLLGGNDPKGWWGDSIQLEDDYGRIGSRLWQLKRAVLNDDTARKALYFTREALEPITRQGIVVRFDVNVEIVKANNALIIDIAGYSQDGDKVYQQKFAPVWSLEAASAATRNILLF